MAKTAKASEGLGQEGGVKLEQTVLVKVRNQKLQLVNLW
jgi:hypothetical protein